MLKSKESYMSNIKMKVWNPATSSEEQQRSENVDLHLRSILVGADSLPIEEIDVDGL
jgi:hypothetical protein